jgi:CheY-like chemotaxis protein
MATAPLRVLVVDDLPDAADSLAHLLRAWGYAARVAYDAPAALDAARAEPPDGILSDLAMPGMDGCALARAVRADPALAGIKLVALSAYADEEHARRAAEAGFDHWVPKATLPEEVGELKQVVGHIGR